MSRLALRRSLILYRGTALVLGLISAWRYRHVLNPDGVSYLDLGDAMIEGGPGDGLNSYWSPLYPLVLALVRAVSGFSASIELPMVHLANLLIFLGAVVAFEMVLGELIIGFQAKDPGAQPDLDGGFADSPAALCLVGLGYPLFLLCTLRLIGLGFVTPDLAVATFAMTAVALVLRMTRDGGGVGRGVVLGLVLGMAYLAKTPMLIIGVGILVVGWAVVRERGSRQAMVAATLVMVVIAGVFVTALSAKYGRFTAGDSGRLNYAFFVNRVPHFSHAKSDLGVHGQLLHPLRRVLRNPPVFEFAEPIGGTYPPWFDPGYWYDGVRPRFDLAQQFAALGRNVSTLGKVAKSIRWGLAALAAVVAAALLSGRGALISRLRTAVAGQAVPLAVGLAPVLMYCFVHIRGRFIGGFVLLACLGALAAALHASGRQAWLGVFGMTVGCLLTATVALGVVRNPINRASDLDLRLAAALHQIGVEPGAEIGFIGNAYVADWARLGRFRIIADIPKKRTARFWSAGVATQLRALEAFRTVGVRAVVATSRTPLSPPWRALGETAAHWVVLFDSEPGRHLDGGATIDRTASPPSPGEGTPLTPSR